VTLPATSPVPSGIAVGYTTQGALEAPAAEADTQPSALQLHISPEADSVNPSTAHETREANEDQEVDVAALKARVAEAMKADEGHSSGPEIADEIPGHDLLARALEQNAKYEAEMEKEEGGDGKNGGDEHSSDGKKKPDNPYAERADESARLKEDYLGRHIDIVR